MSTSDELSGSDSSAGRRGEELARGIVPSTGERFHVPETVSVMRSLVFARSLSSPLHWLWILSCILTEATLILWYAGIAGRAFFIVQFLFWRAAYNVGLGLILHHQSKSRAFENWYNRLVATAPGWLLGMLRKSVVFRDEKTGPYHDKNFPAPFNAWMLYRFIVNVILANDLLSYFLVVFVYWAPPDFSSVFDILHYAVGLWLIIFAIWSKSDAHRIIGDFAWYWGDFFFLLDKNLVFDGIFEMFPHPMYTVGYAFMYGFTLMAKSYTVFYVSLAGHFMQICFLAFVENPHIDKTYNAIREPTDEERARDEVLYDDQTGFLERKELITLRNFSIHRATDIVLAVLIAYCIAIGAVSFWVGPWLAVAQAVFWRVVLNIGLGWILRRQSQSEYWTKTLFRSPREAFDNWKRLYNTVVTVTNISYLVAVVRLFQWESPFAQSFDGRVASIVVGGLCVSLQVYVAFGVYEVIGDFGYFYGDFFIRDLPTRLSYSGIYRYLNNPDSSLGFAGYYGLALASGSYLIVVLAVFSHAMAKLFEKYVERPHAESRYGGAVRKAGGLRTTLRSKAAGWKESLEKKRIEARDEYERGVAQLKEQIQKRKLDYERLAERFNRMSGERRSGSDASRKHK